MLGREDELDVVTLLGRRPGGTHRVRSGCRWQRSNSLTWGSPGKPVQPARYLFDVVGNDVSLAIQRELYLEFHEPGFAPAPLLEHLITAGYLGRKSGRGFRDYS